MTTKSSWESRFDSFLPVSLTAGWFRTGNARTTTTKESAEDSRHLHEHRQPTIWFEVEDFLRYFDHFRNPTGLQRVPFEIFVEAERIYGCTAAVKFCRLSLYTKQFQAIGFDAVISAYLNPPGVNAPWKTIWEPAKFWSEFSSMWPLVIRHPRFFFSIFKVAIRDFFKTRIRSSGFERIVQRGDFVVSLGAGWGVPRYMKYVAEAKQRYGIRFSMLIHDLIPIENESFVEQQHAVQFRNWLKEALPVANVVLTTSKHSRDALVKFAAYGRCSLPRVEVLELGSGFSDRPMAGEQRKISFPQRYVLFVSTIEIRKNHKLLVRVWRRLLERHGADAVPTLIFAGQVGWLVDDLLADLAASNYLKGKIQLMPGLSDAELRQAYRSCLFSVFPSHCEGWGLPIAESLMQGKFCVASNRAPIPEVAGNLIDYFDPSTDDDALAKIERLLLDPGYLVAREARLQDEYQPRTWANCVHALLAKLHQSEPGGPQSSVDPGGDDSEESHSYGGKAR
jgi:glycosyltransferase involved in cell wall biosynthesis